MPATKRPMRREDLLDFLFVRGFDISSDGQRIVYVREWIDSKDNKHYSNLWMYDRDKNTHTQFTFGKHKDRAPSFNPNGDHFAFCSVRDKQDGIFVMGTEGGAEQCVLKRRGEFGNLSWSPDGSQLLFLFRKAYNAPVSESEVDVKASEKEPVYRHIKRLFFRLDGDGWRPEDGYHIWRFDLAKNEAYQVTKGRFDEESPVWSPDGRQIAFISNRRRDPDKDFNYREIIVCDRSGRREKKLKKPEGPAGALSWSPDGQYLAYLGHDNPTDGWGATNDNLWIVPLSGGKAKNLTRNFDASLYDPVISDLGEAFGAPSPAIWSANSKHLLFGAPKNGAFNLHTISRRGGTPEPVTSGKWDVQGYRANGSKNTIAMVISDPKSAGDIWTLDVGRKSGSKPVRVTEVNKKLFSGIAIGKLESVWFKSGDGTKVQGWILKPPKFNPRRKYPSIVQVHGGPRAMYGWVLFHEMQYLAACGYVVFFTNPRGSQGYGEEFTKAIIGDWGGPDWDDVVAGTDYLCEQKYIDPKRVGITGGSYGGYMTNWAIGHTNRYKAAVTQRSVVNLVSFFGTSDVGYDIKDEFLATPWDNVEELIRMSPLTYVKNMKTPLLIIHSENDLRCNIEQADELFACLKYLGRTVEYVRFPEEPHGLSRGGRPDRRMARLKFISDWFDKYL